MNHLQKRGSDALAIDVAGGGNPTSERSPMSPAFSFASIPPVSPDPAYIAAAAAANVVTSEVANEFHVDLPDGASISPGSLHLINTFLDRLLYNFLSSARSTTLTALRSGVTEVLKQRLAKEAIAGADAELEEYLGGDVDELELAEDQKAGGPWDVNIAWKRARLRCMLYTRLGDMEEDEEEMFLQQDNLQDGLPGSEMQAAVAIFLTSILEFIGEHALTVAAQAAYKRHETKASLESANLPRVIVEEIDMEKNALNSALGRLWRSWRASLRSPRSSVSRISGAVPRAFRGFSASSRSSVTNESNTPEEAYRVSSVAEEDVEDLDPAEIPLPITLYDVAEIEVPGYTPGYANHSRKTHDQLRPQSMFIRAGIDTSEEEDLAISSEDHTDNQTDDGDQAITPKLFQLRRPRASSLPLQPTLPFIHTHSPSATLVPASPEELSKLKSLKDSANPIIDTNGDTLSVIGDYAIPRASSVPVTPQQGYRSSPVVNGLSDQSFYHEDELEHEVDPTVNVLQFDRNDYEIGEHEHLNLGSRISTVEPTKNLSGPFGSPPLPRKVSESFESPVPVSPLLGPSGIHSGTVSPLEAEFSRQEVSRQNDDNNEADSYALRKKRSPSKSTTPNTPHSTTSIAAITSPFIPASVAAATIASGVAAASAAEIHRERKAERVQHTDQPVTRANQGRQRSREGPTVHEHNKDDHREAFVMPQDHPMVEFAQEISVSKVDSERRRRQPAEKAIVTSNLPSLRESSEMPHPRQSSAEPNSPTRQQPVSRKAVPATKPVQDVYNHRQTSNVVMDGEQHPTSWAAASSVPVKESVPSSRVSDASSKVPNTVKSSTGGKTKGRVGSLSTPSRDSVPSQVSSDERRSANYDRYSRSSTSNSDSHRDFDQLINSGETLQYTLTPQNMREIEERGHEEQNIPAALQIRSRFTLPEQNRIPQASQHSPLPQPPNGLRPNPVSEMPATHVPVVHTAPAVKRGPQLIAKDARTERTDTSDLKDFFRYTGPDVGAPNGVAGPRTVSKAHKLLGSESSPRQPLAISPVSNANGTTKNKLKFEPREAKVNRVQDDTAMLAEFLRQGPPGAHNHSKLGADELNSRLREAPSVASTQDSFMTKSVQSSTNSRVGLLDSSRAANNISKTPQWERRMVQPADEYIGPVRKQRRVRDPYAIDTDSEDEDDAHTPTAGRRENNEESLLDFLRNAEPPDEMHSAAPPPVISTSRIKDNSRKSGNSTMKSKFGSTNKKNFPQGMVNGSRSVSSTTNATQIYQSDASKSANAYPETSRQPFVNPSNQVYRTEDFNGPIPRMSGNGVRQARKLARDSREDSTSIRELADFLRNTAPPPTQAPLPPIPAREESGGFTRMFSRRKKSVIA